jgi:DUF4097 and DUF4098 domain-containing protein YvlB
LALVFLGFAGCGHFGNPFTATQELSKSFPVKRTPHVVVDTFNGKIEVIAGPSEGKVEAKVTKRAGGKSAQAAEENLKDVAVTMGMEDDAIHIKAELLADGWRTGNHGADVELQVPSGSVLELKTSNGKITATGPGGDTNAHTSNGQVEVKGAQGKIVLRSSNGTLKLESVKGPMDVQTSNGKIEITSSAGTVEAQTSNGSIHYKGKLESGQHSFRSSNGSIDLELPSQSSFEIEADTSNSRIDTDFPISHRQENEHRTHLHGTVGEHPAALISAHTSNGKISIRQRD